MIGFKAKQDTASFFYLADLMNTPPDRNLSVDYIIRLNQGLHRC